jgi:hypothetical protein
MLGSELCPLPKTPAQAIPAAILRNVRRSNWFPKPGTAYHTNPRIAELLRFVGYCSPKEAGFHPAPSFRDVKSY